MKTLYLLIGGILLQGVSIAQDSLVKLTPKEFRTVVNNKFNAITNGNITNGAGGFASIDLKESSVSFAPNFVFKNGNILQLQASGGVTDGLFKVVNDSKINTNVSVNLQYNFLRRKKQRVSYLLTDLNALSKKKTDVEKKFNQERIKLECRQKLELAEISLKKKNVEKDSLTQLAISDPSLSEKLNCKIQLLQFEIDTLSKSITEMQSPDWYAENLIVLTNSKLKALDQIALNPIAIQSFKMDWFSFGYGFKHDGFNLFDSTSTFDNQVTETSFLSHQFQGMYSYYNYSMTPFKTFFFRFSATYGLRSNITDLTKTEIVDAIDHSDSLNNRISRNSYLAYTGDYKENVNQLDLNVEFYYFLFEKKSLAIHVYPQMRVKDENEPLYNLGFGLLLPLKDKTDEKAIINAELYYDVKDLSNSKDSDLNLFKRNEIGLRFSFPINFNQ